MSRVVRDPGTGASQLEIGLLVGHVRRSIQAAMQVYDSALTKERKHFEMAG